MTERHKLQDINRDRTLSKHRTDRQIDRDVENSDRETKTLRDREINKWVKDRQQGRLGAREMGSEREGPRDRERETERKDKRERQKHAHVTPLI